MFCDCFGDTVKDTFQVIQLTRILNLYYDDFAFAVFGFDIHGLNLSSTLCWLLSLSSSSMIFTSSPKRTVKNPSSTSKFAFWRRRHFTAQSNRIYLSCCSISYLFWLLQSYDFFQTLLLFHSKTKSLFLLSYTASVYRFGWLIIMTVGYWIKLHLSFITLYSLVLAGEGQVLHLSFRDYCCKLLFFLLRLLKVFCLFLAVSFRFSWSIPIFLFFVFYLSHIW